MEHNMFKIKSLLVLLLGFNFNTQAVSDLAKFLSGSAVITGVLAVRKHQALDAKKQASLQEKLFSDDHDNFIPLKMPLTSRVATYFGEVSYKFNRALFEGKSWFGFFKALVGKK